MNPISPALTKVIAGLSLALLVSLGGNVFFLWHAGKVSGKAEGELERVALASKNVSLSVANETNKAIAKQALTDNSGLMVELREIVDSGSKWRVEYRTVAGKAPLPAACKPGQERQLKVNKLLGPET